MLQTYKKTAKVAIAAIVKCVLLMLVRRGCEAYKCIILTCQSGRVDVFASY